VPFLIGLLLVVPAQPPAFAGLGDAAILSRAEVAFSEGVALQARPNEARPAFAAAADAYQELEQRGARNAGLYRNLGNACVLAGRLPQAILAYDRGLRLAPGDRALQDALEAARDQVNYPPGLPARPPSPAWPSWLPWPAPGLLLSLAFTVHALAWLAGVRWLMTRRAGLLRVAVAALVLALLLGCAWAWQQWKQMGEARHPLVVIARDGAVLRLGNGPSYPPSDELPALALGMEGHALYQRDDWLQIELPGGRTGWVRRSEVLLDVPTPD
jgi:tetratricopeptide (TPR) repeat protein